MRPVETERRHRSVGPEGTQSERDRAFEDLVRAGVARMKERRKEVRKVGELAKKDPYLTAKWLLHYAAKERDRLRRELRGGFSFTAVWEQNGFRCRFSKPGRRPRTPEQAARWTDALVYLAGYVWALRAMHQAAANTPRFDLDRPKAVCNAYLYALDQAPAIYAALAEYGGLPSAVREYASVMLAAWTRSQIRAFNGSKVAGALKDASWASDLVNSAALAWSFRRAGEPIKRSVQFRDSAGLKQKDGKRQRVPGAGPDYINLVSRALEGKDIEPKKADASPETEPPEIEAARFADREKALQRGRDAGLPPREMQVYELVVENPARPNREIADKLGITPEHVRAAKSRIRKNLSAA